jgi:copper chaperone NosL
VIGSDYNAGMGGNEAVPFSDETAARSFAGTHGGTLIRFDKIPESYILDGAAIDTGDKSEQVVNQ